MCEECAAAESWSTGRKTSIRSVAAWKRPRRERLKGYHIDVEQDGVAGTMKTGSRRSDSTRRFEGMCERCVKAAADDDLNKLVPTQVSAVAPTRPTITPVPRFGQKPMETLNVDDEFVKAFGLDAESMHSEERSLRH